ncbi:MAG TPA: hypothetical protein VHB25_10665, partial [Gemmatimonadaceae bacterium]|nr:hypothetical protein [Gemmatimonadaceae bacterium]
MTIHELVERERTRLRRLHLIGGLALALGATALVLALGASMLGGARWMALPRPVPVLVWLVIAAADVAIVLFTARRLDRRATQQSVAAAIEREQAMRAGALRGVLEVSDSGALGRRAAASIAEQLAPAGSRLAPGEQKQATRGAAQATGVATVALAALAFAAPRFNDGLLAIMRPVSAWNGTLLPRLEFQSLPPVVLRGEPLRLHVAAAHRTSIQVVQRTPGEAWSTQTVTVEPRSGVATIETGPLRGDLTVVASDGRSTSDTAVVHVTDRPFVGAVTMRAVYPAYLGRQPEGLPIGEPARVPQGTVIEVAGRASTALRSVRLASDGDTVNLGVSERAFTGRFEAKRSGRFTWLAAGVGGPIADLPLPIELDVVADSAPHVELVSPVVDTIVAADDQVTLHATASDDHGLAKVEVVSWRSGSAGTEAPTSQRVADATTTVWDGSPTLDLSQRGLKPGDALHVKIVATDNSPWAQRGESREVLLKVPTMEERRAIARAAADSAVSQAQAAASAEKSLEQRTSAAAREQSQRQAIDAASNATGGDKKDAMSYNAAEKAKAVAKDQRALTDQVKQLQKNAAQLQQQLAQAGALDSSLARQLQEAQALLRDALSPELLAQMQKLDQATQQLSSEQSQAALHDLQAMQEKLREQLEKSAEMLKRAALEGAMQTLKDEGKDIADRDRALADSLGAHKGHAQAQGQDQADAQHLADRSQRFEDELKKLKERLDKENADPGAKATEQAREHANAAEEAMRQA